MQFVRARLQMPQLQLEPLTRGGDVGRPAPGPLEQGELPFVRRVEIVAWVALRPP